jgi:hypothetical protein
MHLRIGELIATTGALPRREPFAWTRAGAPYFAYSWLSDVSMYALLRAGGPWALHVLHGALFLTGTGAVAAYARRTGLHAFAATLLVTLHLLMLCGVASTLRPQVFFAAAAAVAWVAVARLAEPGPARVRWPYLALWGAGALAANTHLFAPSLVATLVPLVPGLVDGRARAEGGAARALLAGLALTAGLASTPYLADWPAILTLNLAPNPLLRPPSPIEELAPGWRRAFGVPDSILPVALVLAVAPLSLFRSPPCRAPRRTARGRCSDWLRTRSARHCWCRERRRPSGAWTPKATCAGARWPSAARRARCAWPTRSIARTFRRARGS